MFISGGLNIKTIEVFLLEIQPYLLLFRGGVGQLVCVGDLGELQHLPGQLQVAGVLLFLSLLVGEK